MERKLTSTNAVVIANAFNPSVVRESFLNKIGVVTADEVKPGFIFSEQVANVWRNLGQQRGRFWVIWRDRLEDERRREEVVVRCGQRVRVVGDSRQELVAAPTHGEGVAF